MDHVLLIDDEVDVQYSFRRIFQSPDIQVSTANSGEEGLRQLTTARPDLVIMDIRMGGISGLETLRRIRQIDAKLPVIMMTAYGTTQTAIEAMKLGAFDYLLKPFDIPRLKEVVANGLKAARDMKQVVAIQMSPGSDDDALGIIGRSHAMQDVFKLVGQLAATDATALITGESGTGKELVARAVYHHSARVQKPFLAINCAALPDNLLESELFGHEKGAFTGATSQRIGKFEQCNGGTLFLDEIGDMAPSTQTKILRVLQSGTFERVGGNQTLHADVRIIAATNKDLEAAVARREFREDLFYRLNVVRIRIPPLRERLEDIPLLASYFLRKHARHKPNAPKSISPDAIRSLASHPWPGNVRELENAIQRAIVMAKSDVILPLDLPEELRAPQPPSTRPSPTTESIPGTHATRIVPPNAPADRDTQGENELAAIAATLFQWARSDKTLKVLPAVERQLIIHALAETHGNQVQAAKILGITRATLRKRMEKFDIRRELTIH